MSPFYHGRGSFWVIQASVQLLLFYCSIYKYHQLPYSFHSNPKVIILLFLAFQTGLHNDFGLHSLLIWLEVLQNLDFNCQYRTYFWEHLCKVAQKNAFLGSYKPRVFVFYQLPCRIQSVAFVSFQYLLTISFVVSFIFR